MTDDPYRAPTADLALEHIDQPGRAVEVARRQRVLLIVFLINILASVGIQFMPPHLAPVAGLIQIVVGLAVLITTARLAWVVYGKAGAVIMTLLALVPLLNLLVILAANARASRLLKELGVRVGFMGVDVAALEAAIVDDRKQRQPVIGPLDSVRESQ